jgi:hypothetical protein
VYNAHCFRPFGDQSGTGVSRMEICVASEGVDTWRFRDVLAKAQPLGTKYSSRPTKYQGSLCAI